MFEPVRLSTYFWRTFWASGAPTVHRWWPTSRERTVSLFQ